MHVIAAKAVCFKEAAEPAFGDYQRQTVANAARLGTALADAGFRLVSGGTDNHLLLVDVFSKGITGKVAEAPVRVYDTSGPQGGDVRQGLAPLRESWIAGRGGIAEHPRRVDPLRE